MVSDTSSTRKESSWAVPKARHPRSTAPSISFAHVEPLFVWHGRMPVTAFRIGPFAYVTDCSADPGRVDGAAWGHASMLDAFARAASDHLSISEALE